MELTSSLTEAAKQDLKKGLVIGAMSPEELETESEQSDEENSSENESNATAPTAPQKKKRLVVRRPSWRSQRFNEHINSLDRKSNRRASCKTKSMARPRHEGAVLDCEHPEGIPTWMIRH